MSDTREAKAGLIATIRNWIRGAIIDDVPSDLAECEFECRKLECTQGKWETCENRLRGMRSDKA